MKQNCFQEGELCFDFKAPAEKFDEECRAKPQGMSFVDFIVSEKEHLLLVEVKDPSDTKIPEHCKPAQLKTFAEKMKSNELINLELVPKARDSYCYLHLMERDDKPFIFVVLLGLSALPNEKALLGGFKDRLLSRLRKEADEPWKRQYVKDCVVLTEDNWAGTFPKHQFYRMEA